MPRMQTMCDKEAAQKMQDGKCRTENADPSPLKGFGMTSAKPFDVRGFLNGS
jgi:hypothetical protein